MIQLGLRRAAQLFRNNPQPWRAVHVAGTNGKGTVCAYLSALLHSAGITCGRFTSPHLIDKWDCITINEKPVSETLFREVEANVLLRNREENIDATEFEVLTATAFDIFTHENVEVGVVEVGMGGRDDATNVLKSKSLTIITRIGLDHQAFLGNTVEEITRHKCGIFVKDVPVIYSAANPPSVVDVIQDAASNVGAGQLWAVDANSGLPTMEGDKWQQFLESIDGRDQQKIAVGQAWLAYRYLYSKLRSEDEHPEQNQLVMNQARDAIMNLQWPGRMQYLDIEALVPGAGQILLDGAHNVQAAETLAKVVDHELRVRDGQGISWVIGSTQGRDIAEYLRIILRPGDQIACVEFGPVDGMPWVKALSAEDIQKAALQTHPDIEVECFGNDITRALQWAVASKNQLARPSVVTGSLYLVSDLLRLLRQAGSDEHLLGPQRHNQDAH
ncbi:uncharacterized protein PV09_03802 [Verruconis gallopava]|uniref:Mur ligase central domain-containing protein n=1 Tax=Verruconis gallopava TaxID=253628 RepID=A0A0D2AFK6_9PEZI|nr:uncharacterized protein PV09_03802 [Verruconis gallopava]KIW05270.1 hypothetical protein PV09_03802 [Verruconis gallopava]